jgi:hypothetical protein
VPWVIGTSPASGGVLTGLTHSFSVASLAVYGGDITTQPATKYFTHMRAQTADLRGETSAHGSRAIVSATIVITAAIRVVGVSRVILPVVTFLLFLLIRDRLEAIEHPLVVLRESPLEFDILEGDSFLVLKDLLSLSHEGGLVISRNLFPLVEVIIDMGHGRICPYIRCGEQHCK